MIPAFLIAGGVFGFLIGTQNTSEWWGSLLMITAAAAVLAGVILGIEDLRRARKRRRGSS